jgi:hypothetical protein
MPDLTLQLTVDQSTRLCHAVGIWKGFGRDATIQEATQYLADYISTNVKNSEMNEAMAQVTSMPVGAVSIQVKP